MLALSFLSLLSLVPAAQVHTVDDDAPADFATIQAAVDAAQPGDIVLVRAGVYDGFSLLAKGVAVIADADADVEVRTPVKISDLPAGEVASLRGLRCAVFVGRALAAVDCDGSIWIEDCHWTAGFSLFFDKSSPDVMPHGASFERCVDVTLQRSQFRGGPGGNVGAFGQPYPGGSGLYLQQSTAVVSGSETSGGGGADAPHDESYWGGTGGDGIQARESVLFVGGLISSGGTGGWGDEDFDLFTGTSQCGRGGDGGSGIRLTWTDTFAPSFLMLRDQVYSGGLPGLGLCAPAGNPGQALVLHAPSSQTHTVVTTAGVERGFWASSPVRMGTNARLYFQGLQGDFAFAIVSANRTFLPLPDQALPLVAADLGSIVPLAALSGNGLSITQIPVPLFAPGLDGLMVTLQAGTLESGTGQFQLAPASALSVLNPAF